MTTLKSLDLLSEDFADFALDEIEEFHTFTDRSATLMSANGQEFTAVVLGFGSSYSTKNTHKGHMPGTPPVKDERCPACRWADVAILRVSDSGGYTEDMHREPPTKMYAVALMGKSVVPGETHRLKTVWTADAAEVLQNLHVNGAEGAPRKLPIPNALAFRRAARVDYDIMQVLEEHDEAIPNPTNNPTYQGF